MTGVPPTQPQVGPEHIQVLVVGQMKGDADAWLCRDSYGRSMTVYSSMRVGSSREPRVGESWVAKRLDTTWHVYTALGGSMQIGTDGIGLVELWPGGLPPEGAIFCDGQDVRADQFAFLASIVADTFGPGSPGGLDVVETVTVEDDSDDGEYELPSWDPDEGDLLIVAIAGNLLSSARPTMGEPRGGVSAKVSGNGLTWRSLGGRSTQRTGDLALYYAWATDDVEEGSVEWDTGGGVGKCPMVAIGLRLAGVAPEMVLDGEGAWTSMFWQQVEGPESSTPLVRFAPRSAPLSGLSFVALPGDGEGVPMTHDLGWQNIVSIEHDRGGVDGIQLHAGTQFFPEPESRERKYQASIDWQGLSRRWWIAMALGLGFTDLESAYPRVTLPDLTGPASGVNYIIWARGRS